MTDDEKDLGPDEYTPTPAEVAAIQRYGANKRKRPPAPHVRVADAGNGEVSVSYKHASQSLALILMENSIGVSDEDFWNAILQQMINATMEDGKVSEKMLNFALGVIRGLQPKDEVEVMLAAQMAAVHIHTMSHSHRLACAQHADARVSFESGLNKLARTFTAQVEGLKRYRSTGQQTVRVERVFVGEGGRAIVGNVGGGAGLPIENGEQIHGKPPAIAAPDGAALPITLEANGQAVRERSGARQDPMPLSRRSRRRAEG